jgi:hypothetical protein
LIEFGLGVDQNTHAALVVAFTESRRAGAWAVRPDGRPISVIGPDMAGGALFRLGSARSAGCQSEYREEETR